MMMSREELIEEARRAYLDAWAATTLEDVPPGTRSRNGIIAALAVFEKAHAPSDDEREVLLDELEAWQRHTGDAALGNLLRRVGSAIRRSEAHAPTDDFPHGHPEIDPTDDEREALRIAHLDARQAAYRKEVEDWFVDHDSEPEIAGNAFFRGWDAAVDGGFRRSEVPEPSDDRTNEFANMAAIMGIPEPQGEPSDAQVEFPFTHDGVTLEQDDGGIWVRLDISEFTVGEHHPYWIGPRALAALRAAGGVR